MSKDLHVCSMAQHGPIHPISFICPSVMEIISRHKQYLSDRRGKTLPARGIDGIRIWVQRAEIFVLDIDLK